MTNNSLEAAIKSIADTVLTEKFSPTTMRIVTPRDAFEATEHAADVVTGILWYVKKQKTKEGARAVKSIQKVFDDLQDSLEAVADVVNNSDE